MAFIGKEPLTGAYSMLDAITASATASYSLTLDSVAFVPESANHLLVSLNGSIQKAGSSYTVSGSTLTFSSALTSSDSIDFVLALGNVLDIGTPSDATVTNAKTNFVSTSSSAGLQIKGDGTTDGTLQLNCSQNSHGIKLKSPAHSTSSSYTLTFPGTDPSADKFLKTDGSGNLSFADAGGGALEFVAAQNTTVTSVITFENCFSSTYKNYAIFFTNINFSSDSDLGFRFGTSGGYDADFKGASHGYESGQVGTAYNSGQTYAKPAGALFGVDTAANSQQGMTGSGIIYMPYDSTSAVYGTFQVGCRNEANSQWVMANSWFTNNSDTSYTNLRAYSTSSNDFNTHGRIAIYGIKDS